MAVGTKTAYIEPGSPWENVYCENFHARSRDELRSREIFYSLRAAQIITEE
jgi:putative transposase